MKSTQSPKHTLRKAEYELLKTALKIKKKFIGEIFSGSMEPYIMTGEKIEIEPVDFGDLKEFDIITFYQNQQLVCHFVAHVNSMTFNHLKLVVTRSTKWGLDDFPLKEEEILGKVTSHKLPWHFKLKSKLRFFLKARG